MTQKICSVCHTKNDLETGFYRQTRTPDGYAYRCKKCANAYSKDYSQRASPEKRQRKKEYQNEWIRRNPERMAVYAANRLKPRKNKTT